MSLVKRIAYFGVAACLSVVGLGVTAGSASAATAVSAQIAVSATATSRLATASCGFNYINQTYTNCGEWDRVIWISTFDTMTLEGNTIIACMPPGTSGFLHWTGNPFAMVTGADWMGQVCSYMG